MTTLVEKEKRTFDGVSFIPFTGHNSLLTSLNSSYKTTTASIAEMLNSYDANSLAKRITALLPVEISESPKEKAIFNSSIGSDYAAGASRTTGRGKQNEARLEKIRTMAKADLDAAAEALKAQLQAELGDAYNETEITKYLNDAMNDTIALFTANVARNNGHDNYNSKED